jgi:glutaredoxin-like YruB-family protein
MGVELYKWTDEYGRIHYTDKPPANENVEKINIKIKSYDGPAQVLNYAAAFNKDPTVKIYSAKWCGVCKRAKKYMQERNIKFRELDIEKDSTAKREFRKLNGRGVPVILVGRQRMNGFSPAKLESMLEEVRSGALKN